MFLNNILKSFRRNLLYYSLALGIGLSSCSKDDSGPINPSGGGNGNGGNNGYVEDRGNTNNDGKLGLEFDGQKFDIHVSNDDGYDLSNVEINGINFGHGIFGFSFKDFSYDCFSRVIYKEVNLNNSCSIDGEDSLSINQVLNKARGRDYEKITNQEDEPYIYNLSHNPNLTFLATIPFDETYSYYRENEHSIIFDNISILEFIVNNGLYSHPLLTFALEANGYREKILNNYNNSADWTNKIASLFGLSFEKEAYYIDIYKNQLGVLTHQTSTKEEFVTLRGKVYGNSSLVPNSHVEVVEGPTTNSTFSDSTGRYFLKKLREGVYTLRASFTGFNSDEHTKLLHFNGYTQPRCEISDFYLSPERHETLDTLVLQPGADGIKDAFVHVIKDPDGSRWGDNNTGIGSNFSVSYSDDGENTIYRARYFIKFNNIPYYPNIVYVGLGLYGSSADNSIYKNLATVNVKRVTNSWSEDYITWNNQSSFNQNSYDTKTLSTISGFTYWNLTNLYDEWRNNTYPNYGVVFTINSETYNQAFYGWTSENFADILETPKMIIVRRIEQ